MKQKTVYKISVFLAVIGLTMMYASSAYIEIEEVDVGEIEKSWTGRNMAVQANVTSFAKSGDHVFMEIEDPTGTIKVVEFDSNTHLSEGDSAEITGHVELYEGELEIIAQKVETVS